MLFVAFLFVTSPTLSGILEQIPFRLLLGQSEHMTLMFLYNRKMNLCHRDEYLYIFFTSM